MGADLQAFAQETKEAAALYEKQAASDPSPRDVAAHGLSEQARMSAAMGEAIFAEEQGGTASDAACPVCIAGAAWYSCPTGWFATLVPGECTPGSDYMGPCGTPGQYVGLSVNEKKEFERDCGVCWPCSDDTSERDATDVSTGPSAGSPVRAAHSAAPSASQIEGPVDPATGEVVRAVHV